MTSETYQARVAATVALLVVAVTGCADLSSHSDDHGRPANCIKSHNETHAGQVVAVCEQYK